MSPSANPEQPAELSFRKTRARTGCLTCRRRRIKCDETKPECQRCRRANLVCEGYQSKRHVGSRSSCTSCASCASTSNSLSPNGQDFPQDGPKSQIESNITTESTSSLFGHPSDSIPDMESHPLGLDVLAHYQYTLRTSDLLFDHEHIFFWRDRVLSLSWKIERLFDAVVALGGMHRALLLSEYPNCHYDVAEAKRAALSAYERAYCREFTRLDLWRETCPDALIVLPLLLAYFECSNHKPAGAFQHLRTAKEQFLISLSKLREQNPSVVEPLGAAIRHLDLTFKIILPHLVGPFHPIVPVVQPEPQLSLSMSSARQEKQALINLLAWDDFIHVAIWKDFSPHALLMDADRLEKFRYHLEKWREVALYTFRDHAPMLSPAAKVFSNSSVMHEMRIPPVEQKFASVDAAIGAALYHGYMSRVMAMLSSNLEAHEGYEYQAYIHAYELLRIVSGIWDESNCKDPTERPYVPSEAMTVPLTTLLFLASQCAYNVEWQQWIIQKLRSLGLEGLHNGKAYATCMEVLEIVQNKAAALKSQTGSPTVPTTCSPLGHVAKRIAPVLFFNPAGTDYVAYYVQGELPRTPRKKVLARATWAQELDGSEARDLTMQFFDDGSVMSDVVGENCAYSVLGERERVVAEWQHIL